MLSLARLESSLETPCLLQQGRAAEEEKGDGGDYGSLVSLCSALGVRRTTHYGLLLFLQFKSYRHKFLRRQQ